MANDCLFCSIAAGEVPADIVQQDDLVVAFRDITPKAPTHVLLIPRRHVESAAELGAEDGEMLARLFSVARDLSSDAEQACQHLAILRAQLSR